MSGYDPKVYIVDDDEVIRDSLAWMLKYENVQSQQFNSAETFLEKFNPDWRGCILLDVRMPGKSGLRLQRELNEFQPVMPIILLTAHATVGMVTSAMKSGAFDFIRKPYREELVMKSVRAALQEESTNYQKFLQLERSRELLAKLTEREKTVLDLIMNGLSNKQIAFSLQISDKTVEAHRSKIMQKTGSASLPQLVQTAMKAEME